jgi:hypothetical protein
MKESSIVERIIYGYTFKIDSSKATNEEILESAKRWLSMKSKYRNFCPFIIVRGRCSEICGALISSHAIKEGECPMANVTINTMSKVIEEVILIGEGAETRAKTDIEWAEDVLDEEIVAGVGI